MNRTKGTFEVSGGTPKTTPARVVIRERAPGGGSRPKHVVGMIAAEYKKIPTQPNG